VRFKIKIMQRRTVIKQLVFASGAIVLLPACLQKDGKASVTLKNIKIAASQEKLLAALTDTILPTTDTPGAKDIGAHLFVLRMVDDCYKKEDQQKFISGLAAFEKQTDSRFGKSFVACASAEREALLKDVEAKKTGDAGLEYFYGAVKGLTVQAFTSSKYYLTSVQGFKLVPGPYKGCVPVKKNV